MTGSRKSLSSSCHLCHPPPMQRRGGIQSFLCHSRESGDPEPCHPELAEESHTNARKKESVIPANAGIQSLVIPSPSRDLSRMRAKKHFISLMHKKIITILGPTASGKSDLAIRLALWLGTKTAQKKFDTNGAEIISVDSRQIYRNMNIGTGKVTKKEMRGIPHSLLDIANPCQRFTVAEYREFALKKIQEIFAKNKIPILCGGTGFYAQAVLDGISMPEVAPDWQLRKKLEKKSVTELYKILKKLDSRRAKNIEKKNPRRLIRAIEIIKKTGKIVPVLAKNPLPYPVEFFGVKRDKRELKKLIHARLIKRLKHGMLAEVKSLRQSGLSWKRLEEFGLEYRFLALYLQKKISYQEMIVQLEHAINQYARRQMVWFKRDSRIKWVKNYPKAQKMVEKFLEK